MRDHGSLDQVRAVEMMKKGQTVGIFLTTTEPTEFSSELDVKCERNRGINNGFKNFDLGN